MNVLLPVLPQRELENGTQRAILKSFETLLL